MKNLDVEQDALKKITDYLLEETLEPAKVEAEWIIADAKKKADEIVSKAEADSRTIVEQMKKDLENEQKSFKTALQSGLEKTILALKQKVLKEIFSPALQKIVDQEMQKPEVVAQLIGALVEAIKKEGLSLNLEAFIPTQVSAQAVNALLTKEVLESLKNKTVTLGKITSGVEVKLVDKQLTIEMTGKALQEALLNYIRRELRELIFLSEG